MDTSAKRLGEMSGRITRKAIEDGFTRDPSGRGVLLGLAVAMDTDGVDEKYTNAVQFIADIVCVQRDKIHEQEPTT